MSQSVPISYLSNYFLETKLFQTLRLPRLQRWRLLVSSYPPTINYSKEVQIADSFSRLPLSEEVGDAETESNYLWVVDSDWIQHPQVQQLKKDDVALQQIIKWIMHRWTRGIPYNVKTREVAKFFKLRYQLTVQDGCIWWGNRIVLTQGLWTKYLNLINDQHWHINKMFNTSCSGQTYKMLSN